MKIFLKGTKQGTPYVQQLGVNTRIQLGHLSLTYTGTHRITFISLSHDLQFNFFEDQCRTTYIDLNSVTGLYNVLRRL